MSSECIRHWRTNKIRLNPCKELVGVREIMKGANPHFHNLAEAIAIKREVIIYPKAQSPLPEDSSSG